MSTPHDWHDFDLNPPPEEVDVLFWLVNQKLFRVGHAFTNPVDGGPPGAHVCGYGETNDKVFWQHLPEPPGGST